MTPLETLKAARQLITDPAKWTQGTLARTKFQNTCQVQSKYAECFCAWGAVHRVSNGVENPEVDTTLQGVCSKTSGMYVAAFNDTHTHAEVLALFDAAIAELEGA